MLSVFFNLIVTQKSIICNRLKKDCPPQGVIALICTSFLPPQQLIFPLDLKMLSAAGSKREKPKDDSANDDDIPLAIQIFLWRQTR